MMLDPKPRSHRLLAGACAASAVVIGVLACNAPEPAAPDTAVRSALGLEAPPEPPPAPAASENHPVAEETFEAYKVPYDPAEVDKLPPPPPPPPKPGVVDEVVRVKGALLAGIQAGRANYLKSAEKPPEVVETKGLPRKLKQ